MIRNPNTACADFEGVETPLEGLDTIGRDECDEVGTAPQFGARCGEASLPDGDCDSSGPTYGD